MKTKLFLLFRIAIFLILGLKVLNLFLHFGDRTNQLINVSMFSLIGISYAVVGFNWEPFWQRVVFIACGLYLLAMAYFSGNVYLNLVGILCILTPVLIARFSGREKEARASG
jgi:hypothetical protein